MTGLVCSILLGFIAGWLIGSVRTASIMAKRFIIWLSNRGYDNKTIRQILDDIKEMRV